MSICDQCRNKTRPYWHIYNGRVVMCVARDAYLLPEPLTTYEIDKVLMENKCNFFEPREHAEDMAELPEKYTDI